MDELRERRRVNLETFNNICDRFWSHVDKSADCWIWTGTHYRNGYGQFKFQGKTVRAHRFAYRLLIDSSSDAAPEIVPILQDIFWLSRLNWNSPDIDIRLPITLRFTDQKLERYALEAVTDDDDGDWEEEEEEGEPEE